MDEEKAIVIFKRNQMDPGIDLEIPLTITANELIFGLNEGFQLGMNMDNPTECYMKMTNPIALLRGERVLSDFGIRNGSIICVDR
nr:EsaB/YukD family protein [uncultured Butyrivibrio sp.]